MKHTLRTTRKKRLRRAPFRRWLWSLFVVTLCAAIGTSWLILTVRDQRRQKAVAEAIENDGGRVVAQSTWLGTLLRDPSLARVDVVRLSGKSVTDAALARLQVLNQLKLLEVCDTTKVSDAGLAYLQRLTELRFLVLGGNKRITGTGLRHIEGMSHLILLDLSGTSVTDSALAHLEGLRGLCLLDLRHTEITYAAVDRLQRALPRCTIAIRDDQIPRAGRGADENADHDGTGPIR